MKLSTRKELLNYADSVLVKIRENIKDKTMNEIDWEEHERWASGKASGYPGSEKESMREIPDFMMQEKLRELKEKYASLPDNSYTPEQKEKEIDEMLKDIEILRQHLNQPRVRIPRDPRQQTELQRILVNKPRVNISDQWDDPYSVLYKDPKTGLLWHYNYGGPAAPPEWRKRYLLDLAKSGRLFRDVDKIAGAMANNYAGVVEWDESRGWLWNIWNKLFNVGVGI